MSWMYLCICTLDTGVCVHMFYLLLLSPVYLVYHYYCLSSVYVCVPMYMIASLSSVRVWNHVPIIDLRSPMMDTGDLTTYVSGSGSLLFSVKMFTQMTVILIIVETLDNISQVCMFHAGWRVADILVGNWVSYVWSSVMDKNALSLHNQSPSPARQSTILMRCLPGSVS